MEKMRQAGVPHTPVDIDDCDDGVAARQGNTNHTQHPEGAGIQRPPIKKSQAEEAHERKSGHLANTKKQYPYPGEHR